MEDDLPQGTELAFRLFWAWTNHPDENFARKAWANSDLGSRTAWERSARMAIDYVQESGR